MKTDHGANAVTLPEGGGDSTRVPADERRDYPALLS